MPPDAQTGFFDKPLRVGQDSTVGTGRDLSLQNPRTLLFMLVIPAHAGIQNR